MKNKKEVLREWIDQLTQGIFEELTGANPPEQPLAKPQSPSQAPEDEIGEFYVVYHPEEGSDPAKMVQATSALNFSNGVTQGTINPQRVAALVKNEGRAQSRAAKSLQEFQKNLVNERKVQVADWQKKRKYVEDRMAATQNYYGKEALDEATQGNMQKMQEIINLIDKKIAGLSEKLTKKSA